MKKQNYFFSRKSFFSLLVLLGLFLSLQPLQAQTIPIPDFDLCAGVPTATEVRSINRFLAYTHAPILNALYNIEAYDIPTTIDFDGNLNSLDNWENARSVGVRKSSASVYYAVLWTENNFIITYSLFYPRDYSQPELDITAICFGFDQHENDLERIIITVDRCSGSASMLTTSHGKVSRENCVESGGLLVTNPETMSMLQPGVHPDVFISPGSHAIYLSLLKALNENPCAIHVYGINTFLPIPSASRTLSYNLIDIFDPVIGPWLFRGQSSLFTTAPFANQSFRGDNFGDDAASAPWNGDWGMDPIVRSSSEIPVICDDFEVDGTDRYLYNPYYCNDTYFLSFSKDAFCSVGDQMAARVSPHISRKVSANIERVEWEYPAHLTCDGCEDGAQVVTFTLQDIPPAGVVSIRAIAETIDCGKVPLGERIWAKPTYVPFFIEVLCVGENNYVWLDELEDAGFELQSVTACDASDDIRVRLDADRIFFYSDQEDVYSICVTAVSPCGDLIELEWLVLFSESCSPGNLGRSAGNDVLLKENDPQKEQSQLRSNSAALNDSSKETALATVSIAPNPADTDFQIMIPDGMHSLRVQLFDLRGRLLLDRTWPDAYQVSIPVGHLAAGLYFVKLIDQVEGESLTKRVVIE